MDKKGKSFDEVLRLVNLWCTETSGFGFEC